LTAELTAIKDRFPPQPTYAARTKRLISFTGDMVPLKIMLCGIEELGGHGTSEISVNADDLPLMRGAERNVSSAPQPIKEYQCIDDD
jgi:hypothetical protein